MTGHEAGTAVGDDAAASGRHGRRGVVLLVGAVVLVVAAVAGALIVRDRLDDDSPYPDEWDERVAPIAEWVAGERDLEYEHPVEVVLLDEDAYRERSAALQETDSEEDRQQADDTVSLLRALGLVTGEVDLESAGADLMGEGSAAYYSDEEEKVYVRGDELTPAVRVTLAHELTHVLQDQHFDLARLRGESDETTGLRAMAEGDANRIEAEYADEELSSDEQDAYEEESEADGETADEGLEEVPPALVALFAAPYTLGDGFLAPFEDDNAAIDEVLQDPPSEQELLDPLARGTERAEPVEVTAPEAPDGAEVIDEDTFGPVAWYLLLATRGAPAEALAVVDGWGGDAFVSYREDDRVCAEVVVAGDDDETTAAFREALDAWVAQDPSGGATIEDVDGGIRLRSCDPGEDAAPVGELSPDVMTLPLVRAQIEDSLQGQEGASAEEARCTSTRIIEELSLEQLTAQEVDPAVAEQVQALADECRA